MCPLFFIFSPNDSPSKRMLFMSSKKVFLFLRCWIFVILSSPFFLFISHCFRQGFSKGRETCRGVLPVLLVPPMSPSLFWPQKCWFCSFHAVYRHFAQIVPSLPVYPTWGTLLNKEHFYGKIMQRKCTKI